MTEAERHAEADAAMVRALMALTEVSCLTRGSEEKTAIQLAHQMVSAAWDCRKRAVAGIANRAAAMEGV